MTSPLTTALGALYRARDRHPRDTPAHRALDAAALRIGRCPSPEAFNRDWADPVRRAVAWWAPADAELRELIRVAVRDG